MNWWSWIKRARDSLPADAEVSPEANEISRKENSDKDTDFDGADYGESVSPSAQEQDDKRLESKAHRNHLQDRTVRYTEGTHQVQEVLSSTKVASRTLLIMATVGALIVFLIGLISTPFAQWVLSSCLKIDCPANSASFRFDWHIYILLIFSVALLAVLGVTLWLTGLKFAGVIYGSGKADEEDVLNSSQIARFLSLAISIMRRKSGN